MNTHCPLLIVDDSDEDFEITCWALTRAGFTGHIYRCARAEEALQWLCAPTPQQPRCGFVLLDLNLPGMNGCELLAELRRQPQSLPVPVVILSTSTNPRDIATCYQLGVTGYLCKPMSLDSYIAKLHGLMQYLFDVITLVDEQR